MLGDKIKLLIKNKKEGDYSRRISDRERMREAEAENIHAHDLDFAFSGHV